MQEKILVFSGTCPQEMFVAKSYGFGANALNYCCPTDELIRPVAGQTTENQCAACYKTTLSNCGDYGE